MNYVAMQLDNNQQAFFELVKAGLWEKQVRLSSYEKINFSEVYRLAEEQSVIGLVTAGLEHVADINAPQDIVLEFVGTALQLEQQNTSMNSYIETLIGDLRRANICVILVKGQGIAQCYERPLWRASGDIDLLMSDENYKKAKAHLIPLATHLEQEYTFFKHLSITLDGWEVELHGTLYSRLSKRIDRMIDEVQRDVFCGGSVRSWQNGRIQVYLPAPDNDVIFIFTHFLHHFFFEGVGLRQICDWCRLLWTYRDKIDVVLLEKRLRKMRLITEWRAFATYAVLYLDMPVEAIPLYDDRKRWGKKANRINSYILRVGNFGHNQTSALTLNQPYLVRKFISFWIHAGFTLRHFFIFPKDSIVFFAQIFRSGLHAVVRGE